MRTSLPPPVVERLLCAVDLQGPFGVRDLFMLVFVLHTGLRISEWCSLRVRDVAIHGEPLTWLYVSEQVAKGRKPRWVSLNVVAQRCVAEVLVFNHRRGFSVSPDAPLWVNRFHRPLSPRVVQLMMVALRDKAGLPAPCVPHQLRHVFATRVMERTGNLRHVQQLLGHAKLSTVECYTALSWAELEKATDALTLL